MQTTDEILVEVQRSKQTLNAIEELLITLRGDNPQQHGIQFGSKKYFFKYGSTKGLNRIFAQIVIDIIDGTHGYVDPRLYGIVPFPNSRMFKNEAVTNKNGLPKATLRSKYFVEYSPPYNNYTTFYITLYLGSERIKKLLNKYADELKVDVNISKFFSRKYSINPLLYPILVHFIEII